MTVFSVNSLLPKMPYVHGSGCSGYIYMVLAVLVYIHGSGCSGYIYMVLAVPVNTHGSSYIYTVHI